MPSKRPIQAFYVSKEKPKRTISQTSTRSLSSTSSPVLPITPSLTFIEELYPYDSFPYSPFAGGRTISNLSHGRYSLDSPSKLSSRDSYFSKISLKDVEKLEKKKKKKRRRWLPIIIALIIAACLIAVVILLAFILTKKGKEINFSNDIHSTRLILDATTITTTTTTTTTTTITSTFLQI